MTFYWQAKGPESFTSQSIQNINPASQWNWLRYVTQVCDFTSELLTSKAKGKSLKVQQLRTDSIPAEFETNHVPMSSNERSEQLNLISQYSGSFLGEGKWKGRRFCSSGRHKNEPLALLFTCHSHNKARAKTKTKKGRMSE